MNDAIGSTQAKWVVTAHAAQRYLERAKSGAKTEGQARDMLAAELRYAEHVGTKDHDGFTTNDVWFLPLSGCYVYSVVDGLETVAKTVVNAWAAHATGKADRYADVTATVRAALAKQDAAAIWDALLFAMPALVDGIPRPASAPVQTPVAAQAEPRSIEPLRLLIEHRVTFENQPPTAQPATGTGSELRRLRKAAGLTQAQAAYKCRIPLARFGAMEMGREPVSAAVLAAFTGEVS